MLVHAHVSQSYKVAQNTRPTERGVYDVVQQCWRVIRDDSTAVPVFDKCCHAAPHVTSPVDELLDKAHFQLCKPYVPEVHCRSFQGRTVALKRHGLRKKIDWQTRARTVPSPPTSILQV